MVRRFSWLFHYDARHDDKLLTKPILDSASEFTCTLAAPGSDAGGISLGCRIRCRTPGGPLGKADKILALAVYGRGDAIIFSDCWRGPGVFRKPRIEAPKSVHHQQDPLALVSGYPSVLRVTNWETEDGEQNHHDRPKNHSV